MILILKGKAKYWVIGLVEVTWKVCAVVVTCCLKRSVELHDALHGFREERGTGAANLEDNLEQQLDGIAHDPLFQVLLYVYKSYDSFDRGRFWKS